MNPFLFGSVAQSPNYCQRKPLEEALHSRLLSGQNVYLSGPRRTGKTSLVRKVAETHFKNRYFRVDLMTAKFAEEAREWIIDAWLTYEKQHRSFGTTLDFLTSLNIDLSILGQRVKVQPGQAIDSPTLQKIFTHLDQKPKRGQPPFLIFFDEFQALLDLEKKDRYGFLGELRKIIQHLRHVRVVYAGSIRHTLHEIFQHSDSPFYNAAELLAVGPIEPPQRFRTFLSRKFSKGNRQVSPDFWPPVEEITARNPSDMQRLCAAVWETTSEKDLIDQESIPKALERLFEHQVSVNINILDQTTALQKKVLLGIAHHGGEAPTSSDFLTKIRHSSSSAVLKALQSHIKSGVLHKEDGAYRFTNPFFREWIVRTY